jgi:bacterioferritin
MKGDAQVIEILNEVLCAELTGINQYFIHSMMCRNWRYMKLAKHSYEESIDEMKHAQEIIERILYLEGVPNMQKYMKINVGQNVPEQHAFDLEVEKAAVERLNRGIGICRDKVDNGTKVIFEKLLREEEEHVDWLEAQLHQIGELGIQQYLAQQIDE